jgi:twitching motility two-component system response regulator PilH
MHILVVEDNELERLGMATLLARQGYEVTSANNGAEALAFIRTFVPDLIILDMLMPEFDGWQFIEVRNRHPSLQSVPVLIVSGGAFASELWAMELGAEGFLRKPLDTDVLMGKVKALTKA